MVEVFEGEHARRRVKSEQDLHDALAEQNHRIDLGAAGRLAGPTRQDPPEGLPERRQARRVRDPAVTPGTDQCLGQRSVGCAARRRAAGEDSGTSGAGVLQHGTEQLTLADARLAADEHDSAPAAPALGQ
jgi:hypothetical protein